LVSVQLECDLKFADSAPTGRNRHLGLNGADPTLSVSGKDLGFGQGVAAGNSLPGNGNITTPKRRQTGMTLGITGAGNRAESMLAEFLGQSPSFNSPRVIPGLDTTPSRGQLANGRVGRGHWGISPPSFGVSRGSFNNSMSVGGGGGVTIIYSPSTNRVGSTAPFAVDRTPTAGAPTGGTPTARTQVAGNAVAGFQTAGAQVDTTPIAHSLNRTQHGQPHGGGSSAEPTPKEGSATNANPWRRVTYGRNSFSKREIIKEESSETASDASFRPNRGEIVSQSSPRAKICYGAIAPPDARGARTGSSEISPKSPQIVAGPKGSKTKKSKRSRGRGGKGRGAAKNNSPKNMYEPLSEL
jgi:hypothetical protein